MGADRKRNLRRLIANVKHGQCPGKEGTDMDKKIGFIGCGNMATAIIGGILKSGLAPDQVMAASPVPAELDKTRERFGIVTTTDNLLVAKSCEILVLAVKPHLYEPVLTQIKDVLCPETVFVSIAPGKTLDWMASLLPEKTKIIRTMPNTPAMVGEGMTAVCPGAEVTEAELAEVLGLLRSFGHAEVVEEYMMDAVVAVSGSSPAYVYLFIEALADGAVAEGMPRPKAYEFAAQAVLGSAKMVLETGMHPGALKDMVCSPRGTTIDAVRVLEEKGLRAAVLAAMKTCAEKSRNM